VADPKIFKRGDGRQFISSALIYRKCAQRNICLLHGKSGFFEKNMSQWGGAVAPPPPLNPPLERGNPDCTIFTTIRCHCQSPLWVCGEQVGPRSRLERQRVLPIVTLSSAIRRHPPPSYLATSTPARTPPSCESAGTRVLPPVNSEDALAEDQLWQHGEGIVGLESLEQRGIVGPRQQGTVGTEQQGIVGLEKQGTVGLRRKGIVGLAKQGIVGPQPQGTVGLVSAEQRGIVGTEPKGIVGLELQGIVGTEPQGTLGSESVKQHGIVGIQPQGTVGSGALSSVNTSTVLTEDQLRRHTERIYWSAVRKCVSGLAADSLPAVTDSDAVVPTASECGDVGVSSDGVNSVNHAGGRCDKLGETGTVSAVLASDDV